MRWRVAESKLLVRTPVFSLRQDRKRRLSEEDRSHDFFILESVDWVNVVPITAAGEVVLIELYRHGIDGVSLEIPGGMIDPEDPDPAAAAAREMREETGYEADRLEPLGVVHPNPAIQGNYCHSFLARDVRQVGKPVQHGNEETEVVRVPLTRIREMIAGGEIMHALTITAFSFFQFYNSVRR